jgi:transcription initiation factor TFIIB
VLSLPIFKHFSIAVWNIGRDNTTILYACVYASCIIHGIPKTPMEVTAFTEIDKNKMLKALKILKNGLYLNLNRIDPQDFVQRFGSRLHLKQSTLTLASEIIDKLKDKSFIVGKQPKTIVASALYVACRENKDNRTQREIANATGVLEVTIRKRYKEALKSVNL